MKKIFVILGFLLFVLTSEAQSPWIKMEVGGDKVEDIPDDIVYNYMDEKITVNIVDNKNEIYINPTIAYCWDYYREERDALVQDAIMITIATFDLRGKRTGYYDDVIAFLFNDHSGFMIYDAANVNKVNIQSILKDYFKNKSGSVIFRMKNCLGEIADYEVKTIKTLGYENTINGKHVDGDVDVLGL